MITESTNWPSELKVTDNGRRLVVSFEDGRTFEFTAEFLRVNSPSAEVRGHGPGQEVTVAGKRDVTILNLEPVGNYAVRIVFADGHDSGLYSWTTLLEFGEHKDRLWQRYLDRLAAEGMSR